MSGCPYLGGMTNPQDPQLRELLTPDRSVLLVVDVQNDFCHLDGVFGRAGVDLGMIHAAVDRILWLVEAARRAGVPVVWIKTHHDRWTNSPMWLTREMRNTGKGEICATGSWGAEFFRAEPAPDERVVVKHRYSGFFGTSLSVVLGALARPTLVACGVTSNVCVETTVRDAFMRDYHVVLAEDCAGAPRKEEHEGAVYNVRTYFGRVLGSEAIAACWSATA